MSPARVGAPSTEALDFSGDGPVCSSRAFVERWIFRGKDLGARIGTSMNAAASALAGTPVSVSDSRSRVSASTCACVGVCLWLLVMPFEATSPLLRLPGQSISSSEAGLFLVLGVWGLAVLAQAASGGSQSILSLVDTPLSLPWALFLAAVFVSALRADVERANALHMAARFGLAFAAFLAAASGINSIKRIENVFTAGLASGAIVSVLAILEFAGVPQILRFLAVLRPGGVFVVGAQVRAAGPFQYPTIASMYLEVLFAWGVAFLPTALDQHRRRRAAFAFASLILISEAIVLTFTRSGLLTMATTLAVVGAWRWRASLRGWDLSLSAIAALAFVLGIQFWSSHSAEAVRLRMTTEEQGYWNHATFDAPSNVALTTGSTTTVPLKVSNTGLTVWNSSESQPVRLAYHWLLLDDDRSFDFEGLRTEFPERVEPGQSVAMQARVRAPRQPGHYRLMWDVVQEGRLWFSSERDAELFVTDAHVTGSPTGTIGTTRIVSLPKGPARPGRLKLWAAAGRLWLDHPLFGVGPDNFRLLYGPYAGISNADPRVHSNDMYVEILADVGLVGFVAFVWFAWRVLGVLVGLARRGTTGEHAMVAAGLTAALVAIALHGLVDSFFSFTATYVLFAVTLGLVVAADHVVSVHAHRV